MRQHDTVVTDDRKRVGGPAVTIEPPWSPAQLSSRADSLLSRLSDERVAWAVLYVAMALSVAFSLWLTRGLTFHEDDYLYFVGNRGFDLHVLLAPHNGHLIFVVRLMYAVALKLFGASHYVVFRALEAIGVVLLVGVFFALAKNRVGSAAALAPSVLLLFLGSGWQDTLDTIGIAHVYCIAAGLGAFLALDRQSSRRDLIACALLIVSIATHSDGLFFAFGTAVSVLMRDDRRRRVWIFLVPLALYGVWYLAPHLNTPPFSTSTGITASNVLLIPNAIAVSAAAVAAAATGLSYNFDNPGSYTVDSGWGYVLALVAVVALALRLRRGRVRPSLWASITVLLTSWMAIGLATHYSAEPNQDRYVFDGVVLGLLVAADAVAGIRLGRKALIAIYTVTALSLAGNIALLRVAGQELRSISGPDRAELAAVDIARDHVAPSYVPGGEPQLEFLDILLGGVRPYLEAADYNGSFAFTLPELRAQPEGVRELADSTLAGALRLSLVPATGPTAGTKCLPITARPSAPIDVPIRPPGLLLRSTVAQTITLRRFAARPTASVGKLLPGEYAALRIPADRAPDPWHLMVTSGMLTACPLSSAG